MFKPITRGVLTVVTTFTFMAGESQACCFLHCFDWCKPAPAPVCPAPVTTYAPACPAPAPACNVCPQQVNYVPQTCYQTSYACVPVTTCKPVCDPCGGAQMQPVTTFVRRPIMVPYTSYRPVVAATNYAPACPTCSAMSGAAYSSPYYSGTTMSSYTGAPISAAPSCPTCGGGSAVSYAAPGATYATPGPAATIAPPSYVPSTTMPGAPSSIGVPSLSAPPGSPTPATGNPPSTFQTPQSSSSQYPTAPIQDTNTQMNSSTAAPRLLDPQNRTTSTGPMIGPATVQTAIFRTADRSHVFHPAVQASQPSDGFSQGAPVSDGWSSAESK